MLKINKTFCGDSLNIIKRISNNSIDLILTDPPYNISSDSKLTMKGGEIKTNKEAWGDDFQDKWDSVEEYLLWLDNYFIEFRRVLKEDGSLIMFFDRKLTGLIINRLEEKHNYHFKNKLYFEKNNPLPCMRKNNYRSTIEEAIWVIPNKKYKINFLIQQEMKQIFKGNIGCTKETKHPNEKYRWMIKPIIERHSREGDLILDPFAGSGTIGIIAKELNRNYIMIDKKEEYAKMIKKRFIMKGI